MELHLTATGCHLPYEITQLNFKCKMIIVTKMTSLRDQCCTSDGRVIKRDKKVRRDVI